MSPHTPPAHAKADPSPAISGHSHHDAPSPTCTAASAHAVDAATSPATAASLAPAAPPNRPTSAPPATHATAKHSSGGPIVAAHTPARAPAEAPASQAFSCAGSIVGTSARSSLIDSHCPTIARGSHAVKISTAPMADQCHGGRSSSSGPGTVPAGGAIFWFKIGS